MNKINISLIQPDIHIIEKIQEYGASRQLQINTEIISWADVRKQLGYYAVSEKGPDISAVGAHWLSYFVNMDAVRTFSAADLREMGDSSLYSPDNWKACTPANSTKGIPFSSDVRVIYYRRDLLAKAGIDEKTAFASIPQMDETLQRLKGFDDFVPFVIQTQLDSVILHNAAMWIWQAGGDFMSPDGKQSAFSEPEALKGIQQHLEIWGSALGPETQNLDQVGCTGKFIHGEAAVMVNGAWILKNIYAKEAVPEVIENLGIAHLPFPTFIGGQNLFIWNYAQKIPEIVEFVQHLVQADTQFDLFYQTHELPARLDVIQNPDFMSPEYAEAFLHGLKTGRGFAPTKNWGDVENYLLPAFRRLWQLVFDDPNLDLEKAISKIFVPLAKGVDRMISSK